MDTTRRYRQRTSEGFGNELLNIGSMYTYVATNDVWNTCYGVLVGANVICLTNEGNRIYVFRAGEPSSPPKNFEMTEPTESINRDDITKHNESVDLYTKIFNNTFAILEQRYTAELNILQEFINTNLQESTTSVALIESIEINLNKLICSFFKITTSIVTLYRYFRPAREIDETFEQIVSSPALLSDVLNTLRLQKVKNITNELELNAKLKSAINSETLILIDQINFFNIGGEEARKSIQRKALTLLVGEIQELKGLGLNDIISKTYEIMNSILISPYIRKKYYITSRRQGFNIIFANLVKLFEDISLNTSQPSLKRKADVSAEADADSQNKMDVDTDFFQNIYEFGIGIYKRIRGLIGGHRRQRGGEQTEAPPDFNGNYLIQRQLNRVFLPIAVSGFCITLPFIPVGLAPEK
jgi:hypothetical protein